MTNEEKKNNEKEDEICAKLKKRVDAIIAELEGDMEGKRYMSFSENVFTNIRHGVSNEIKEAFVDIVRHGKELNVDDDAYDKFIELARKIVRHTDVTYARHFRMDAFVREKCKELVKGSACISGQVEIEASTNTTRGQSE